jgi:type IV pili sensor histidine kinase/response regulator
MRERAALILASLLTPLLAATADDRAVIRFQPNANRLLPGFEVQLTQLKAGLAASRETSLIMVVPRPNDAGHRHLLAARQSELDRQLARLGLTAEHQSDAQMESEGNDLILLLRTPPVPPAAEAAVAPEPPQWIAESGHTLRETLQGWAAKAGWTIVWQSSFDYPLMASARLSGDFPAAVAALIEGFSEAAPPPAARIFRANNVVIIH